MKKKRVFGTGGELLVHQLVAQGVKYAFTNTGSAEAGFFNALLTVPGVQPILLLAESLVLSAADGYAKASREAAFVNVHLAAGTRQGSGQLQNAYFDGSPMVVTAAMRDAGSFGDHNTLGSSGGFSQMGAVEDITKRRWEVWDARGIPTVTRRAFKEALTFPTGPVYVAYTSQALESNDVEGVIQAADAPHMGLLPEAGVIQSIWDALVNAEKPLLVCGQDIGVAGAGEEILTLAERLALPVATGFFDYASFPVHHPNYVGQVESVSEEEYDVVCCVGYRQNTRGYPSDLRFAKAGSIIGIGHDPSMLGNTFPLDIAVWGDVRHTVRALNGLWKAADSHQPHVQRRAAELRRRGEQRLREQAEEAAGHGSERPIHPNWVAHLATRTLPEGTMVVSENFRNTDHLLPFGLDKDRWSLIRTYGGSLGHGIGAAVGAQLGAPDRPVVCSLGDGAVMYSASGFWTMARYGLPILTLVWNNLNYQTVRTNFDTFGGEMAKQQKYPEVYLGDPEIDFVMLAKSQGIEGLKVTEPKELEAALRRGVDAMNAGEPYVLDVRVATVGAGADSTWHQRFKLRR
ncbi:MAG TPA: thiamine pyrophosphate-binding protein [Candidatus Acidoferrum sp.]|jgi:benzoylformate decarboxylase|nr:thiamine pyrophosphate-binding protein [Candidatus Acidoferrum sp.]